MGKLAIWRITAWLGLLGLLCVVVFLRYTDHTCTLPLAVNPIPEAEGVNVKVTLPASGSTTFSELFVLGHLAPYPLVWISAPVEGATMVQLVPYGSIVAEEQLVFRWSHPSLAQWLEQNHQARLSQQQRVLELKHPEQQETLTQARHQLAQSERLKIRACSRAEQSNHLYSLGLISGEERLRDEDACLTQKESYEWAERRHTELNRVLQAASLTEAEQLLSTLDAQHGQLERLSEQLEYKAAASGRLWPVPEQEAALWKTPPIAMVAELNRAYVMLRLDEYEVAKLPYHPRVSMSIPALNLHNQTAEWLGIDPLPTFDANGLALYEARTLLTLPKDVSWRIGYSVQARVMVHDAG
ncbi:MAG: hypothetical protein V4490_06560 [Pseudomonadota bacterium]